MTRMSGVVVLVLVAALAACGGGESDDDGATSTTAGADNDATTTTGGGAPADADPCALLTAADLETVTGVAFGEGVFNETLSSDQLFICDWTGTGGEFATAQVLIVPSPAAFEGNKSSAADALGGVEDISVPGAEAAYVTVEGSIVGMLIGDWFVQVAYIPSAAGDVTEQTTQLAGIVAGSV